jgi:hypothetical protein
VSIFNFIHAQELHNRWFASFIYGVESEYEDLPFDTGTLGVSSQDAEKL